MKLYNLDVNKIMLNPRQPRKDFNEESLEELTQSVREYGIIQPIIVRKIKSLNKYEIVAGERRFRASQRAGLKKLPVIEIESSNLMSFELAVLENIQRKDLNPVEEAEAYNNLMEIYGYTQEELARKFGKTRSGISNKLRILNLPEKVKKLARSGELSYGQARTLLSFKNEEYMEKLAEETVKNKYSVHELEKMSKKYLKNDKNKKKITEEDSKAEASNCGETSEIRILEDKLREYFESKVNMRMSGEDKGKIEIEFYSYEDLGRILQLLNIEIE